MPIIGIILAGACLFAVVWWWSESTIEASDALLLAVILCGLIFGLFSSRSVWQFLLAFIPLGGVVGYAVYSFKLGSARAYYKARCQEYIAAIHADPRNTAARQYLAEALYNMGELDRAVEEMQAAVDIGATLECQYKLTKWSKERYFRDTPNPVCRWCQTESQLGSRTCSKCGSDLPYENAFTRWLTGGGRSNARYYLILITGAAVISVSLVVLPLKFAFIPFFLCVIALAGWALLASARS